MFSKHSFSSRVFTGLFAVTVLVCFSRAAAAQNKEDKNGKQSPPPVSTSPQDAKDYKSKYTKDFPIGKMWPEDISRAQFVEDAPPETQKSNEAKPAAPKPMSLAEIKKEIVRGYVTSEATWKQRASIQTNPERAGWIIFEDGHRLRWIMKGFEVLTVIYPDGGTVYIGCRCHGGT